MTEGLDTREKLLLGVFISAGLLFLLCVICIVIGGLFGENWRKMWSRNHQRREYFDNQKNYPLEPARRPRGSLDDLDVPRRENRLYGSHDNIDRYDNRNSDHYRRYDREYYDDRDYRLFDRHDGRDFLINRGSDDLYSDRRRTGDYRGSREYLAESYDKSQVWYTRQIIEYADNCCCCRDDYSGVPRYPDKPAVMGPPPRERLAIIDAPPDELVSVIDEPPRESFVVLEYPTPEPTAEPKESVILHIDHEPEYTENDYEDLGFYAVDTSYGSPVEPPYITDKVSLYVDEEPLYAKPVKSKVRVTEIGDDEGRENIGNHETQIIPYRREERNENRKARVGFVLRRNGTDRQLNNSSGNRDPIVDEKLDHVLYKGKGNVTEVYDNSTTERPRLSVTQVY